ADVFPARRFAAHQTSRSRNDVDAITTQHARNLMRTEIHSAAGPRHALQMRDRRRAARVVAQKDANQALRAFALEDEVIDVAFLFEDARDFQLQLRRRNFVPAAPVRESKCGTSETCAGNRAAGHNGGNAYIRAKKILASDSLSLLMIFLPSFTP